MAKRPGLFFAQASVSSEWMQAGHFLPPGSVTALPRFDADLPFRMAMMGDDPDVAKGLLSQRLDASIQGQAQKRAFLLR